MAKVTTKSDIEAALNAQPNWAKVSRWLNGERVDDAPSGGTGHARGGGNCRLVVGDNHATFYGPFGTVLMTQGRHGWDLELRATNGGEERVRGLEKAAWKFATSAWHVAVRGVI